MNNNIKQSLLFTALVIGLSYLVFWGPIALLKLRAANLVEGKIYNAPAFIFFVIGGFVPSLVGIVLTYFYEGKEGYKNLLKSAINIKIGLQSITIILVYVLALSSLQIILYTLIGGSFDFSQFITQLPSIVPLIVLGPLSEEFGWRGFLQKRINIEFSTVKGSIIIGIVWSMWHLPLFFMIGTSQHDFNIPFVNFMISVICSSFIYTYLYIWSKGSLFAALLLHWIATYFLQVITSQVKRTFTYNYLEFIPSLLITYIIILLLVTMNSKQSKKNSVP